MTRAERLQAVVEKVAPKKAEYREKHGVWPRTDDEDLSQPPKEDGSDNAKRGAPYEIKTLTGDRRRVAVTTDDGDVVTGIGANVEEALTALEARVA